MQNIWFLCGMCFFFIHLFSDAVSLHIWRGWTKRRLHKMRMIKDTSKSAQQLRQIFWIYMPCVYESRYVHRIIHYIVSVLCKCPVNIFLWSFYFALLLREGISLLFFLRQQTHIWFHSKKISVQPASCTLAFCDQIDYFFKKLLVTFLISNDPINHKKVTINSIECALLSKQVIKRRKKKQKQNSPRLNLDLNHKIIRSFSSW